MIRTHAFCIVEPISKVRVPTNPHCRDHVLHCDPHTPVVVGLCYITNQPTNLLKVSCFSYCFAFYLVSIYFLQFLNVLLQASSGGQSLNTIVWRLWRSRLRKELSSSLLLCPVSPALVGQSMELASYPLPQCCSHDRSIFNLSSSFLLSIGQIQVASLCC